MPRLLKLITIAAGLSLLFIPPSLADELRLPAVQVYKDPG